MKSNGCINAFGDKNTLTNSPNSQTLYLSRGTERRSRKPPEQELLSKTAGRQDGATGAAAQEWEKKGEGGEMRKKALARAS